MTRRTIPEFTGNNRGFSGFRAGFGPKAGFLTAQEPFFGLCFTSR